MLALLIILHAHSFYDLNCALLLVDNDELSCATEQVGTIVVYKLSLPRQIAPKASAPTTC